MCDIISQNKTYSGCCGLISFICFCLIMGSISTVEPTEYGLLFDTISKKIDPTKVYDNGWYFTGPSKNFKKFPKTLMNIDFASYNNSQSPPLKLKDRDGQEMYFSFSMQYKLRKDKLPDIYNQFLLKWEPRFVSYIDMAVR